MGRHCFDNGRPSFARDESTAQKLVEESEKAAKVLKNCILSAEYISCKENQICDREERGIDITARRPSLRGKWCELEQVGSGKGGLSILSRALPRSFELYFNSTSGNWLQIPPLCSLVAPYDKLPYQDGVWSFEKEHPIVEEVLRVSTLLLNVATAEEERAKFRFQIAGWQKERKKARMAKRTAWWRHI